MYFHDFTRSTCAFSTPCQVINDHTSSHFAFFFFAFLVPWNWKIHICLQHQSKSVCKLHVRHFFAWPHTSPFTWSNAAGGKIVFPHWQVAELPWPTTNFQSVTPEQWAIWNPALEHFGTSIMIAGGPKTGETARNRTFNYLLLSFLHCYGVLP